jgi:predicted transcriptional regulator
MNRYYLIEAQRKESGTHITDLGSLTSTITSLHPLDVFCSKSIFSSTTYYELMKGSQTNLENMNWQRVEKFVRDYDRKFVDG